MDWREVIETARSDLEPANREPEGVSIIAFIVALVLSPVVITIMASIGGPFAVLLAYFAALLGAGPYLILGGPVFWFVVSTVRDPKNRLIALCIGGLVANLGSFVFDVLLFADQDRAFDYMESGFIFAPIYGAMFGILYNSISAIFPGRRIGTVLDVTMHKKGD